MARDSAATDDGNEAVNNASDASSEAVRTRFDRRSYLKFAGGVAAASGFASTASAAGEDYDVITARGQTIRIGQGETFENKLIDLTNGNSVLLYVTGTNSTIRNIGFEGLHRGDGFMISIDAGYGDILVENVYLGDGSTKEGESFVHGPGAVFMHRNNSADVTFRHCNVQGWPNNGFYCSNTAHGGSVRFEHCFGKNNGVTTFRCASADDAIVGCVAYNDDTDYGRGYGGYSETNGRPVWVWNGGTVTIRDSHFADGPYPSAIVAGANGSPGRATFESGGIRGNIRRTSGSTVTVGSAVSSDPDLSIPDGVPTSPEAAASGGSGGSSTARGDHEDLRHTYEFVAEGEDEPTDYYFEIEDGPIEPSTYNGAAIEDDYMWTSDDGTRAAGRLVDGRHAWEFDTLLVDVTVEGPAGAIVDDVQSNLDRYPLPGATGDEWKGDMPWHADDDVDGADEREFEHTYEFVAEGEDEPTDYYFEIEDGPIEPSTYNGAAIEDDCTWVSDDGTRAAGRLVDGRHAWEFDTLLVDVTVEGPAGAIVDDKQSYLSRYPRAGATGDEWKGDMPWHDADD
ncbi:twin-arginine translocation signal domain-containing protein [Natronorubrum halophilum]|uniref:twin-arginine translocation signal domain-containing protein n=1 Tax=Natronorubrum halophilum TaxID=1702106 RepID=UPI001EE995FA|nr:twin-arginine translocation signal domain-containing protein [Natronorubrum halophilum]